MTTYSRPGAFIEETLLPLSDNSTDTTDAVAAFVGTSSKGGPTGPTLVTSWSQYRSLFGDIQTDSDDLGYAVFTFFNNGGSVCYVIRGVNANAAPASLRLQDADDVDALIVTSKSPGVWASDPDAGIFVSVSAEADGRFDLTVEVGQGANLVTRETFVDLSLDPADSRNAVSIVNSVTVGSSYVTLASATGTHDNPAPTTSAAVLAGGADGTGSPDLVAAAKTLESVEGNFNLNLPGVSSTSVLTDVITWAESVGNIFVVVDAPKPSANDTATTYAASYTALVNALPATSFAAAYGPWLYVNDPASRVAGALRLTAPGGSVLGQYMVNDTERGVQKVPAGTGTALSGVRSPAFRFDATTLDGLNTVGANVIKQIPSAGFCIWGGRTLHRGMPDRYINIRRSLMVIEKDLVNLTRFAVFQVNDSDTWDQISAVISQYLTMQFQAGVLSGSTPDQAFFVICDDTINSATSVNAGVVKAQVGVALNGPAEFVIISIGQFDGGSTVTES